MRTPGSSESSDPFAVLGVPRDCTLEALHLAYRTLARRYHPDVNADPSAAAQMRAINAAFMAARRELLTQGHMSPWEWSGPVESPPVHDPRAPQPRQPPVVTAWTTSPQADSPSEARNLWAHSVRKATRLSASNLAQKMRKLRSTSPGPANAPPAGAHGRKVWISSGIIGGSALLALVVLLLRFIAFTPSAPPTRTPTPLTLTPGVSLSIPWPGLGHVELTDHEVGVAPVGPVSRDSPIEWSADGKYVALATRASLGGSAAASVISVRTQTGQQISVIPGIAARWSPRADQLAVLAPSSTSAAPQLELLGIPELLDTHSAPSAHVIVPSAGQYLTWSPSGEMIAFSAQGQRELKLFDLKTGGVSTILREPPGVLIKPRLWLDDHTILSVQVTNRGGSLEAVNTLIPELRTVVNDVNPKSPLAWSAGLGQLLYAVSTSGQATDTAYLQGGTPQLPTAIPGRLPTTLLGGWSPDSQWLSFAGPTQPASQNAICLARAPRTLPTVSWDAKCLLVQGTLLGLTWETVGARLSYVLQMVGQPATEELMEVDIRIVSGTVTSSLATFDGWAGGSLLANLQALPIRAPRTGGRWEY